MRTLRMIVSGLTTCGFCAMLSAQTLTWLGSLGGYPNSGARAVSAIGPTVTGWASSSLFYDHAFRWTPNLGMQDLGTFGGNWGSGYDVSEDGTTIVGSAYLNNTVAHAFRWQGTLQDLGTLGGGSSVAYAVSANGSKVVGTSQIANATGDWHAFLWDASTNTMLDLGTLGGNYSEASGISANGTKVVGGSLDSSGTMQAFLWTSSTGMTNIGASGFSSFANDISSDGLVAVGWFENALGNRRAVRKDLTTGSVTNLGHLGGNWAAALGTNVDGSIIVGWSKDSSNNFRAFRWTSAGGLEDLNVTYAALLTGGSFLVRADGVSPLGRYIVGQGYNAQTGSYESAFLLDTCVPHRGDVDGNGCVDDADLLAVLFAFGQTGELGRVDVNCDGVVDDADLLIVLFNFGGGC